MILCNYSFSYAFFICFSKINICFGTYQYLLWHILIFSDAKVLSFEKYRNTQIL